MSPMKKAVIFDLDGVIVNSEDAHIEAEKRVFRTYGIAISDNELHRYAGTTAKAMFTELIDKYQLKTTFQEMVRIKEENFLRLLEEDAEPTKGAIELISRLRRANVRLAIASSSNNKWIEYVLRKLRITSLFDCYIGAEDVGHSKPDPEIYLKAARALGVRPDDCVVIEDAKLGIEAAKRAGMKTVGYRNPRSGNQDLARADMIVDDFSILEIKELLS
jgi:beta-phosphoglucomutase family hydrolase